MKDALGHGSVGTGVHSQGTQKTPQLQRRHFEAIAADLKAKGAKPDEVKAMADKLATTNPGFRRDFFVAAATGEKMQKTAPSRGEGATSDGGHYRFKGPGNKPDAVAKKAAKFAAGSSASYAAGEHRVVPLRVGGWGK